jgi:hypothetical protein
MSTRKILPFLALAVVAACSDSVGNAGDLTDIEVGELAEVLVTTTFDATTDVATAESASLAEPEGLTLQAMDESSAIGGSSSAEFTRTHGCALGGQVVIAGTRERVWDREAGTGSMTMELTRSHEDCARPFESAADSATVITLNGAVTGTAYHEWAMGERRGVQTMTLVGELAWETDDGRAGTCVIDISANFDPETNTRTVTGTFCGREIDRTSAWQHGGMHGGG